MKKLFSLVLSVLMALQLLAIGASAQELPFSDVHPGDWHYDAITECYNKGIFSGVSSSRFAPDKAMTRAMFATALGNYSGNFKAPEAEPYFVDVPKGLWYYDAVQWMASLHIMKGIGSGYLNPNRAITRAEAAVMLYRYSLLCDTQYTYGHGINVNLYEDFEEISEYAWTAVTWAAANGIMLGTTKDLFSPNKALTRAQTAAILTRISGMNNPTYETYRYLVKWNDTEIAMDLPVSWKTECLIQTQEKPGESGYLITFISKSNHTLEMQGMLHGGKLFWFIVQPAEEPAPIHNSRAFYETSYEGKKYIIYECRPTDVQWLDDPKGYVLMYDQIDTIMKSVRPSWID